MISKDVRLIEYSKAVDRGNCITHALGAVLAVPALVLMLLKSEGTRAVASAIIYGLSIFAVYSVSAVYHGLKSGEKKRKARLVDHSTIPVLIAGTATPCALLTLYEISGFHSLLVFFIAWFCAVFGIFSKIFFFEKLKAVTMAVYIVSCIVMLASAVPLLDRIESEAFGGLVFGCVLYLIGAIFCYLGIKRPAFHVVFHVFVLLGSLAHFIVIYTYVI